MLSQSLFTITEPGQDNPQGIELVPGPPMLKYLGINSMSCQDFTTQFAVRILNIPAGTYIQVVATANGLVYTNGYSGTTGPFISAEGFITLGSFSDGGALARSRPIPPDTEIVVTNYLRDAIGGTILYQRDVTLDKSNEAYSFQRSSG